MSPYYHSVVSITGRPCNIVSYPCTHAFAGPGLHCFQPMPILTTRSFIASFQRKPTTLIYCKLCHFTKALWSQTEVLGTQYRTFHIRYLLAMSSPKSPRKCSQQEFSIFPAPFIQALPHSRIAFSLFPTLPSLFLS